MHCIYVSVRMLFRRVRWILKRATEQRYVILSVSTRQSPRFQSLATEYMIGIQSFAYSLCSIGLGVITTSSRCDTYNGYCPSILFTWYSWSLLSHWSWAVLTSTFVTIGLYSSNQTESHWLLLNFRSFGHSGEGNYRRLNSDLLPTLPVVALNLGVVALFY